MIDEGYIKFKSVWQRSAALDQAEIDELIRWRKPLFAAGLIGHYADINVGYGNISVRAGTGGQFIISGTQTGHLANPGHEHFALVNDYDFARNTVTSIGASEASSESMTHAALYEADVDIGAIVHVHSDTLWRALINVAPTTSAAVAYGTPEMAQEFLRLCVESDFPASGVAVMAGHDSGLISIGTCMQEASARILALHEKFVR